MHKNPKVKPITVIFRTPNGNEWQESHTSRMLDIFKKDPTVYVILDKETDEIIYRRKER